MQEDVVIDCPFCGEPVGFLIDASVARQTYIEDCSVCCRPIQFNVTCSEGAIVSLDVERT